MATAKSAFTAKELADLKKRLLEEKSELEEQLSTIEEASFAASQSDLTGEVGGYDEENADAGTFTFERERDLSIENNVRDLMRKVDDALERMSSKTFGICAVCGNPIEKARVKALPYVELCIKDAQAQTRAR
jgi:RNA polymerase-binding transcription factor DksA